jgi:WD40 repeat protein
VAVLAALPAHPQGTHLWTQSRLDEFEKGTPQGVALSSDGHLREAPVLKEALTTPSTFVWSIAVDKNGTAYLGTGSPATVQRVGRDGKAFTLFETRDLTVQVVRLGPDGQLYAATLPSGKVYKLNPAAAEKQDDSSATVMFDLAKEPGDKAEESKPELKSDDDKDGKPDNKSEKNDSKKDVKSHYIWDLTFDTVGKLYIATGGPGAVYRVNPAKSSVAPEQFFKSDEQHIRCLAWDAKGDLIAGSDGSGLVYRINPQGKGYVLFDAPRREVTSVAVSSSGTIYAASVGDKNRNPLPPLPVQGTGMVTFTVVQPGSLQVANQSVSAPEGTEIYALQEGQAPRKIWSGKDEVVYALAARPDGLLALTGNRGRVFRIHDDGTYWDVAHLEAQQGLSLALEGKSDIFVGTGNTGKLYTLGPQEKHEYSSDVLDAGAYARFGRVEVQPGSNGYDILTRSGNVEQPVRGWSDWEPLKDGAIASPAGRFLQWKAVLHPGGDLGAVGVNYLPVNAAPAVDEIVVVPGARLNPQNQPNSQQQPVTINFPSPNQNPVITFDAPANNPITAMRDKSAITARWAAHDDNGDDLTFSLYIRGDNENLWRLLKDNITERAYSFDASLLPDGGYQMKVLASDSPSHSPGEALTGFKESDRFEVDTTPPAVTGLKAAEETAAPCTATPCAKPVVFTFDAEDTGSPIGHAEYSLDAGPWQYIEPVGGLSDSKREHYEVHIPGTALSGKPGEHLLTVRAYDRHDNVGLAKTAFQTAPAAK